MATQRCSEYANAADFPHFTWPKLLSDLRSWSKVTWEGQTVVMSICYGGTCPLKDQAIDFLPPDLRSDGFDTAPQVCRHLASDFQVI